MPPGHLYSSGAAVGTCADKSLVLFRPLGLSCVSIDKKIRVVLYLWGQIYIFLFMDAHGFGLRVSVRMTSSNSYYCHGY